MLWLYNHVSLMKSEVNIIRELGYEVYIPKRPPFDVSIAIDWDADHRLSLPSVEIECLNQVNFYEEPLSTEILDIINNYFTAVIFGPYVELVKSLVLGFKGILIFHPFGLEKGMTYTQVFQDVGGDWLMLALEKLGKRFWFGQSYDNLCEIECSFFSNHSVDLPIGMVDTTIETNWNGKKKKVLFICPRIKINSYYHHVYQEFQKNFKDIPYSIGGVQPIMDENDKNILGYLPQNEYDNLYNDYAVMFYHSQEPHHVHYHPFEAIKKGLPLIFMSDGLLDHLGGENLPGRATTIEEARRKCKRILNGDVKYIESVRESQKILLEPMKYDNCLYAWKESFSKIERESFSKVEKDKDAIKKVAVLLPLAYTGGVLDYTIRVLVALKKGIEKTNAKIELIFAYPNDEIYQKKDYFKKVKDLDIPLREYRWEEFSDERLETTLQLKGHSRKFREKNYVLPNDGISYFNDCDYLLFTSDHLPGNAFILKPYGVILHDYIQRYVPELSNKTAEYWFYKFSRSAMACYTTTESTKQDAVNYGGISESKIKMLPLFFENITIDDEVDSDKTSNTSYFLWSTNTSIHKNHKRALLALLLYYQKGGHMKCYITGTNTDMFLPGNPTGNAYIDEIRQLINEHNSLKKNIVVKGYLSKKDYFILLKNAKFLFHPGYADNGNGTVFDAAMLGVPSISSDYPAMRNMDTTCNLKISFFDWSNSEEIANALFQIEKNYADIRTTMPSRENLKSHTVQDDNLCMKLYKSLLGCIGV